MQDQEIRRQYRILSRRILLSDCLVRDETLEDAFGLYSKLHKPNSWDDMRMLRLLQGVLERGRNEDILDLVSRLDAILKTSELYDPDDDGAGATDGCHDSSRFLLDAKER
jgi:hypothetical protein